MDIREQINKLIDDKEIKIKSRVVFLLKKISIFVFIIFTSFATFFLISLISFKIRAQGLGMFAKLGIGRFLYNFPWGLVLVVIGLILVMEWLTKEFNYKKPLIYSLIIVLIAISIGSFALDRVGVHDRLQERGFYKERIMKGAHHGAIKDYDGKEFNLNEFRVIIMPDTKIIRIPELKNNLEVMVIGQENNKIINAQLISRKPCPRKMKQMAQ
jgi:hypothetical protein